MNPLIIEDLAALRSQELRREAEARRRAGEASAWDHPWRRGLGQQLEQWGRRLQARTSPHGSPSPPLALDGSRPGTGREDAAFR